MISIKAFIKEQAVAIYFLLTFIITSGCMVIMIRPHSFPLTPDQSEAVGQLLYAGMLFGPSFTGLLLTGLVDGKAGYRELFSRLTKWRVDLRWYITVLLGAPILAAMVLFVLSLFSPEFIPALFSSSEKADLLIMGAGVGLMVGFFEEIGWTGFVTPKMRLRYNVFKTGIIIGSLWGMWHFLPFWEIDTFSGVFPLALLISRLFSWLPPFRVLMVWVHERTGSLLIVILMHASLVLSTLILPSMELSGMHLLTWLISWAGVLWVIVLGVLNQEEKLFF
jgi:membrane protease YdiL (CAAX protease family)